MNIVDLLKKHEGIRLKAYKDSNGKLTIGVGRNIEDVGITAYEAEMLLRNDICIAKVQAYENFSWFKDLSIIRKDVITSMIFNLGLHGFMEFKKMISAIISHDYELASKEMMNSEWANQVGARAYELSEMMRTDQYLGGNYGDN